MYFFSIKITISIQSNWQTLHSFLLSVTSNPFYFMYKWEWGARRAPLILFPWHHLLSFLFGLLLGNRALKWSTDGLYWRHLHECNLKLWTGEIVQQLSVCCSSRGHSLIPCTHIVTRKHSVTPDPGTLILLLVSASFRHANDTQTYIYKQNTHIPLKMGKKILPLSSPFWHSLNILIHICNSEIWLKT